MFQIKTNVPSEHNGAGEGAGLQDMPVRSGFIGGDRRCEHRRRVLKAARLVLPGKLNAFDATVRDITSSGARVRAGQYLHLPETCELQLPDEKYPRHVRLAWRSGNEAGLVFIQ